ncbi:visual pigment-like receptor peropsin [Actinia tenebrosa]|uniref:Visual pigment-like receptor peropsin n=1 Tax=Actinia tenebrosa TaxID=6105 RepID=A0A6P8HJW6_ACTTE|nr:visual pigment-like receptor peropsin [Actinia tenebrosa]
MSGIDSTVAFDHNISTFFSISIGVLFVLGVSMHVLSLKVLLHHEHKSRELTPYLVNVCLSNFVCLLLQFPLVFVASIQKGWTFLGSTSCYVVGMTCFASSTVVIFTLASMSVKIYHSVINQDMGHHEQSFLRKFVFIWVFGFLIFIPTLFGWNSIVSDGPFCTVNWHAESFLDASYLFVVAFVSFVIPLVVCCLYCIKTSRYVSRDTHHVATFTMQQIRTRALYISAGKLTAVVLSLFFIFWLPYWIDGFCTLFAVRRTKPASLAVLCWLFVSISVVYSPMVFTLMNKRFRRSLAKMLWRQRSHRRVNPRISVDRFESSDAALSSCQITTRACSPTNFVPRSPLVNRSFKMSVFEDVTSEIVSQQKTLQRPELTNEAVTRLIRSSLHAAHELHEDYASHDGEHEQRRKTTVT